MQVLDTSVTIITDKVMAQRRVGEIWESVM
jgi:hypothetical protein